MKRSGSRSKAELTVAFATVVLTVGAAAHAGLTGTAPSEGPLRQRYFTAEIVPSPEGGAVRLGVKLPIGAKIAKTEVFVDVEDKGPRKDWSACDIEKKSCAISDARILRFHRDKREHWQELAVDVSSDAEQPLYAKISVVYQPQSGKDRSGCNRTSHRCGFTAAVTD